MTGKTNGTVQVSKQERMLYGPDWAPVVRRLGDAAQALEDARSLAHKAWQESSEADGFTGGERDAQGRSPETARRDSIYERVSNLECSVMDAFRSIALVCAGESRAQHEAEPSTCADAVNAPGVVVSGFPTDVRLSAPGVPAGTYR
jgi:hypothetical protein